MSPLSSSLVRPRSEESPKYVQFVHVFEKNNASHNLKSVIMVLSILEI